MRWIGEHYAASFKVEDVAELIGISASASYRTFRAVTAMSPIQLQQQTFAREPPKDVTGVGFKVGHGSVRNGVLVSRDCRKLPLLFVVWCRLLTHLVIWPEHKYNTRWPAAFRRSRRNEAER